MSTTDIDADTDSEPGADSPSIDRITNHESLLSDIVPNAGFSAGYLKPFGFENAPEKLENASITPGRSTVKFFQTAVGCTRSSTRMEARPIL